MEKHYENLHYILKLLPAEKFENILAFDKEPNSFIKNNLYGLYNF